MFLTCPRIWVWVLDDLHLLLKDLRDQKFLFFFFSYCVITLPIKEKNFMWVFVLLNDCQICGREQTKGAVKSTWNEFLLEFSDDDHWAVV